MKTIQTYITEALRVKSGKNITAGSTKTEFTDMKEILVIYSNDSKAYSEWERDFESGHTDLSWNDFDEMAWDDAQDEISGMDKGTSCVVIGEAQMWHGKKTIIPTQDESLMEAVNDCYGSGDTLRLTILEDHSIKCEVGHHDGLNVFNIIGLNEKGTDLFDKWAENGDYNADLSFLYDPKNRINYDIV